MVLKRFDTPDESYPLVKGRFDLVRIGGLSIGRVSYEPGWRWSEHVGKAIGQPRCLVGHVGLVVSGGATVAFDDGRVIELRAGTAFECPAVAHDSWVLGNELYVSLHFAHVEEYAANLSASRA